MVLSNTIQGSAFYVNVATVTFADAFTITGSGPSATVDPMVTAGTGSEGKPFTTAAAGAVAAGNSLLRDMGKSVRITGTSGTTGAVQAIYRKVQLVGTTAANNEGVPDAATSQSFYIQVFPSSKFARVSA